MSAQYVYCVVPAGVSYTPAAASMGGQGAPIDLLTVGDLAALVSVTEETEYEQTRRNMLTHAAVLEEAMQYSPILPMRFGTVAPDCEAVTTQLLTDRRDELLGLFGTIDGRVELGLKVLYQEESALRDIVEQTPELRRLRDQLRGRTPEESYYERIHLGQQIEAALQRQRAADAEDILAELRPLACDTRMSSMLTERMVLNASFLVERSREAEFDQKVQEIDSRCGSRLLLRYAGNVPPYNFVNVAVRWR